MSRKWIIGLLVVAMLVLGVSYAMAAVPETTQKEIDGIYQKMIELQKELIQKYVDAGLLTPEQGKYMLENLELRAKYRSNFGFGRGFGWGMGGMMGGGMMGGLGGPAFCPMHAGTGGLAPSAY